MARALIALLLVVGIAGCGGDGAAPVKPPSPDSADPALARAPAGGGRDADPRRPHPRLARALRPRRPLPGRVRAVRARGPRRRLPAADRVRAHARPARGDPGQGLDPRLQDGAPDRAQGDRGPRAVLRRRVVRRLPLRDPDHAAATGSVRPHARRPRRPRRRGVPLRLPARVQPPAGRARHPRGVRRPAGRRRSTTGPTRRSWPGRRTRSCRSTTTPSTRSPRSTPAPGRSGCGVPDSAGRYYVLQFVDAWTNNFAYVGHRATGTGAGTFLLVPPGWEGEADGPVIRLPTDVAHDRRPLGGGRRGGPAGGRGAAGAARAQPAGDARRDPGPGARCATSCIFFEELRVWLQAFPPAERDLAYQERFAPLGLLEAESPYLDPDPELAAALRDGVTEGRRQLEAAVAHGGAEPVNGWQPMYHVFDYNLDFFEVGALDDPAWKAAGDEHGALPPPRGRRARRAVGQPRLRGRLRAGLRRRRRRAARRHAALRAALRHAAAGRRVLVGDDVRPPEFYLVANPMGRYSIGDRTPGLVTADGRR